MSHITKIQMSEKLDLPTIRQMCKDMGFTFMEGQTTYKWYGRYVGDTPLPEGTKVEDLGKCDHAIKVPGCSYEVGVSKVDNHWEIKADFWYEGGLDKALGPAGGKLTAAYGFTKAKMAARAKGHTCYEGKAENGWRKLVVNMSGTGGGTGKPGQGQSWSERKW